MYSVLNLRTDTSIGNDLERPISLRYGNEASSGMFGTFRGIFLRKLSLLLVGLGVTAPQLGCENQAQTDQFTQIDQEDPLMRQIREYQERLTPAEIKGVPLYPLVDTGGEGSSSPPIPSYGAGSAMLPEAHDIDVGGGITASITGMHECPQGRGVVSFSGQITLHGPDNSCVNLSVASVGSTTHATISISPGQERDVIRSILQAASQDTDKERKNTSNAQQTMEGLLLRAQKNTTKETCDVMSKLAREILSPNVLRDLLDHYKPRNSNQNMTSLSPRDNR